ncbi:hypothetical protein GCM10010121_060840 [Streptomyces brasiliensis]|uniref:Uncharacterized protein n=2 Tax=Streptomyces brasiliensis TaxID=1954 RepID=A0A917NYP4_9ACTN|nr:hypothetical protein GCM10010121_060840 [Streptomyces brasiliensis]
MTRLRAAIGALYTLDLGPAELLARVDGMGAEGPSHAASADCPMSSDEARTTGDHCLYLVYDPATGRCTASRAGDAGLSVVTPRGPRSPACLCALRSAAGTTRSRSGSSRSLRAPNCC